MQSALQWKARECRELYLELVVFRQAAFVSGRRRHTTGEGRIRVTVSLGHTLAAA